MFYTFLKHMHIVHSQPLFFSLYLSCTPANWIFFCDMMESMREVAAFFESAEMPSLK